jgi:hypothetical protein
MAVIRPSPSTNNPFADQIGDRLAAERTRVATPTEIEERDGVTQPAVLTREQEHWLAIEAKARLLACRTGSCGE